MLGSNGPSRRFCAHDSVATPPPLLHEPPSPLCYPTPKAPFRSRAVSLLQLHASVPRVLLISSETKGLGGAIEMPRDEIRYDNAVDDGKAPKWGDGKEMGNVGSRHVGSFLLRWFVDCGAKKTVPYGTRPDASGRARRVTGSSNDLEVFQAES